MFDLHKQFKKVFNYKKEFDKMFKYVKNNKHYDDDFKKEIKDILWDVRLLINKSSKWKSEDNIILLYYVLNMHTLFLKGCWKQEDEVDIGYVRQKTYLLQGIIEEFHKGKLQKEDIIGGVENMLLNNTSNLSSEDIEGFLTLLGKESDSEELEQLEDTIKQIEEDIEKNV